jgi:hypothetical protein
MRARRIFTPAIDFMPSRISPSAAGLAHVAVGSPSTPGLHTSLPPIMTPTATPTSYPIIAGEPTPPTGTGNC